MRGMVMANPNLAHIDTHDEASAPEGGIPHGHWRENQGDPIPKVPRPPKPIKTVEQEHPRMWFLYGAAILLTVGICSLLAKYAS
jgi:hypothetical protein